MDDVEIRFLWGPYHLLKNSLFHGAGAYCILVLCVLKRGTAKLLLGDLGYIIYFCIFSVK